MNEVSKVIEEELCSFKEIWVLITNTDVGNDLNGLKAMRRKHQRMVSGIERRQHKIVEIMDIAQKVLSVETRENLGNKIDEIEDKLVELETLCHNIGQLADIRTKRFEKWMLYFELLEEIKGHEQVLEQIQKSSEVLKQQHERLYQCANELNGKWGEEERSAKLSKINEKLGHLQNELHHMAEKIKRDEERKNRVQKLQEEYVKRASSLANWIEQVEEDVSDMVRFDIKEITNSYLTELLNIMEIMENEKLDELRELELIESELQELNEDVNSFTWHSYSSISNQFERLANVVTERRRNVEIELERHFENERIAMDAAEQLDNCKNVLKATKMELDKLTNLSLDEQHVKIVDLIHQLKEAEILEDLENLRSLMESRYIFENKFSKQPINDIIIETVEYFEKMKKMLRSVEQMLYDRSNSGVSERQIQEFANSFDYFDEKNEGFLDYEHFELCVKSQGYPLSVDEERTEVLAKLDPKNGKISKSNYMRWMIKNESTNVCDDREAIEEALKLLDSKKYPTTFDIVDDPDLEEQARVQSCTNVKQIPCELIRKHTSGSEIRRLPLPGRKQSYETETFYNGSISKNSVLPSALQEMLDKLKSRGFIPTENQVDPTTLSQTVCTTVSKCDDILQLFILTDTREVEKAIQDAKLPEILHEYVRSNLQFWRNSYSTKPWMKEFLQLKSDLNATEKHLNDIEKKQNMITNIIATCEKLGISSDELKDVPQNEISSYLQTRISALKTTKEAEEVLKELPSSSKRRNTRDWYLKHYAESPEALNLSDDEDSSGGRSSCAAEGGESLIDVSSTEEESEDMNSFFGAMGL
ncbi:unnamed protein product [Caenorhabditis bovis]|uniref:EF-hand domain-containing protein n=1 Tax=Caenorhabditis bovis TaxID=2654633 RepID=A0A8S1EZX4_9PELO|nr:unnamed protein product [Caenorhabditis bovis]